MEHQLAYLASATCLAWLSLTLNTFIVGLSSLLAPRTYLATVLSSPHRAYQPGYTLSVLDLLYLFRAYLDSDRPREA